MTTKHPKHYSRFSSAGTQKRSGRRKRPANTPGDERIHGSGVAVNWNCTCWLKERELFSYSDQVQQVAKHATRT